MPGQAMVDQVIFWAFAVVSVVAAIGVVTNKSIIKAALLLLVVFMAQAGFFVLNNADFLAIAQVLVYAVGLTIILLFAVMFTGDKPFTKEEKAPVPLASKIMLTIVVIYTAVMLGNSVLYPFRNITLPADSFQAAALMYEGSTRMLGQQLFSHYGLPFELASILLTIAMIGAIVLSKKKFDETEIQLANVKYNLDLQSRPTEEAYSAYSTSPTHPTITTEGAQYTAAGRNKE